VGKALLKDEIDTDHGDGGLQTSAFKTLKPSPFRVLTH